MKTILVTGASGFLGSNLISYLLDKNYYVIGVDKKKNFLINKKFYFINSSLDNLRINKRKIDIIIHLAAFSGEKFFLDNPVIKIVEEIKSLNNIINIAKKNNVKNFIFSSSEWVYGDYFKKKIFEKDFYKDCNISSYYSLSKRFAEDIIRVQYKKKILNNYTILRLGIIYGKREYANSAVEGIFNDIKNKKAFFINGGLESARRFIYVDDVSKAIIKSINLRKPNIINISGPTLVSLKKIIKSSQMLLKNDNIKLKNFNKRNIIIRDISNKLSKKILRWSASINFANGIKKLL
jgi:nucleoside-diphosphate-sugar epimerase